jgi:hypothetical protein
MGTSVGFFLTLITVKLICSFLISILIPIHLLAEDFITRRFHRDLVLKTRKKADVPVYAEGTESSGIGRRFPKQEVTGLKNSQIIYIFLHFKPTMIGETLLYRRVN